MTSFGVPQWLELLNTYSNYVYYYNITLDGKTVQGRVQSHQGHITAKNCKLQDVFAHLSIKLQETSAAHLRASQGGIKIENKTLREVKSVQAKGGIEATKVLTAEKVQSTSGSVFALYSTLSNIEAASYIVLYDSGAKSLTSTDSFVRVIDKGGQREIGPILARDSVELDNVSVKGKIHSVFSSVKAENSSLGDIRSKKAIELSNTSADALLSQSGSVVIKQPDGKQRSIRSIEANGSITLEHAALCGRVASAASTVTARNSSLQGVEAHMAVSLDNCSAKEVKSQGNILIKQSDGAQRMIGPIQTQKQVEASHSLLSSVVCSHSAILPDCQIGDITLSLQPQVTGVLDLTDSTVSGKITLKFETPPNHLLKKAAFKALCALVDLNIPKDRYDERFTLLIKGRNTLPENLVVEGCEITAEPTEQGILLTGKKLGPDAKLL